MFSGSLFTVLARYPLHGGVPALGLPQDGRYVAISNSDVGRMECPLKFLFSQVQHLHAPSSAPQGLGTAWHVVVEDVYHWWRVQDTGYPDEGLERCPFCRGTGCVDPSLEIWQGEDRSTATCQRCNGLGDSALHRALEPYEERVQNGDLARDAVDEIGETLRRMLEGYLHRWESGPLDTIKIVGVEVALARAIVDPFTGRPFRREVLLEKMGTGDWALAGVGARQRALRGEAEVRKVRWPWFQMGRMDVLGADRQTLAGWVMDVKGSTQPGRYQKGMGVDPQLPGYCWLLEPHLEHFGLHGIAGFMYDIANTKLQADPKELQWKPPKMDDLRTQAKAQGLEVKGRTVEDYLLALGIQPGHGGVSVAQNSGVPSWRFLWALQRAGIDPAAYQDHLEYLETSVDPGLYSRPWQRYGRDHWLRYGREICAKAAGMHQFRKLASGSDDPAALDVNFPRTPVCLGPGSGCSYSDICAQDPGGFGARGGYNVTPAQRWSEVPTAQATSAGQQQEPELDW